MAGMRSGAALLGVAVVLISLVGCSSEAGPSAASSRHSAAPVAAAAAVATPTPSRTPTPTPTPGPVVAAPAPKPVVVAAPRPAGPVSPACAGTPVGIKHIYVSISEQSLWACTGPVLVISTAVTTGASALTNVRDATPIGTWRVYSKVRNTVLIGHDANGSWRDPVAYWMPFTGPYGFHDASWQTFPFGSPLYKTQGSHGCVHVPVGTLGSLFNWAPIGTLVTIRG